MLQSPALLMEPITTLEVIYEVAKDFVIKSDKSQDLLVRSQSSFLRSGLNSLWL